MAQECLGHYVLFEKTLKEARLAGFIGSFGVYILGFWTRLLGSSTNKLAEDKRWRGGVETLEAYTSLGL